VSDRFDIEGTPLDGLEVLRRKPIGDHRGFLERFFCIKELGDLIPGRVIQQINRTLTSQRGTVRGLHFQHSPHAEVKFVSCLRGEIFDIAVDVRRGSPTFLQWHSEFLSGENHRTLKIPEGFAHGFQALTNDCEMLYFHTACWEPSAEAALNALDPRLAITWPDEITERSSRDTSHPLLTADFLGVEL
jgi:dTDP-4-dehydrorhamnose 3,5-epimerase